MFEARASPVRQRVSPSGERGSTLIGFLHEYFTGGIFIYKTDQTLTVELYAFASHN